MSKLTERLLQVAGVMAILWFGWSFAAQTVVAIINANATIQQLQQKLQTCEAKK